MICTSTGAMPVFLDCTGKTSLFRNWYDKLWKGLKATSLTVQPHNSEHLPGQTGSLYEKNRLPWNPIYHQKTKSR